MSTRIMNVKGKKMSDTKKKSRTFSLTDEDWALIGRLAGDRGLDPRRDRGKFMVMLAHEERKR